MDFATSWSIDNKIIPNVSKTLDLVISFSKDPPGVAPVTIQGTELWSVSSFKLIVVIATNKLYLEENTNYIYTKASKHLFLLRRLLKAGLNTQDLLLLYKSIVRPVIEYACPLWHKSLSQSDASKLERILKRAL